MPAHPRLAAMSSAAVAALLLAACSDDRPSEETPPPAPRATSPVSFDLPAAQRYHRTATYPVYANRPAGDPVEAETVAEIATVTPDGATVIYTDATGKRIGFLDIADPVAPRGLGTLSLTELGDADDQPTSVAAVGEFVLVVVDTTAGDFGSPSGRVDVVRVADRTRVRSIDLGGQPDSIAVAPDGTFAAIAMENQRDEEATPPGGEEGDLPQPPTGFVTLLDLAGAPAGWTPRRVDIDVDAARAAVLDTPEDLEPEFVSINSRGEVAVTMQENNGVAVIDGRAGTVRNVFSAGTVAVSGIDVAEDGTIDQSGSIPDTPREPDAIGWIDDDHVATANEGDWKGGTRGWTVFDAATGEAVWDAGNSLEQLAVRTGLHTEGRAESKGVEPEGLAITTVGGVRTALVASERSNFVAAFDVSDPRSPQFRQILPTTPGPEGVLPIPARDLLVVSSEVDDAEAAVRSTVSVYGFGDRYAAGAVDFPSIVSGDVDGAPIGWGALSALAADPAGADRLVTVTDDAYGPTRILGIDTTATPALIDSALPVTENGEALAVDAEGVSARPGGGWVLAVEGETGDANALVFVRADGTVESRASLPDDVAAAVEGRGFEGVAVDGDHVWVALQSERAGDPEGIARLGRYTPGDGSWQFWGYPLERGAAGRLGVSEIAVVGGDLLVLERDDLRGPDAAVKKIFRVALPSSGGVTDGAAPPVLTKTLARDLLPDLRAPRGYTQDKVEGFAVAGNGRLYVVTDNDGLDDASGETQFFDLGPADAALGG